MIPRVAPINSTSVLDSVREEKCLGGWTDNQMDNWLDRETDRKSSQVSRD